MAQRRGRRPGKQDTKKAILAASAELFAEKGYDGASIRQIAAAAGVDPALVHHYFGTKEQLFMATVRPPIDPSELIPKIVAGEVDELGERIVDTFTSVWEHPVSGPMFEALLRGAFGGGVAGRLVREFFAVQIVRRVAKELGGAIPADEVPMRANLVATQLFGVAAVRYILKFEPIASAPRREVITALAPTIQRYLTGPISHDPLS